jgi:hypothetical protein
MAILTTSALDINEKEKFSPASSFMESIEYDPKEKTMDISFKSGTKIRYVGVYSSTYLSFKQSPTHDSYYARGIKGNLQSVKIIDNSIGTNKSEPLKKTKREGKLNVGLRADDRIAGTVARAFATA